MTNGFSVDGCHVIRWPIVCRVMAAAKLEGEMALCQMTCSWMMSRMATYLLRSSLRACQNQSRRR